MSFVSLKVHLVFATKNREEYLHKPIRSKVREHIFSNSKDKGIYLLAADGYTDHFHCFVSMSKDQCISNIAQLIKGESSHWINKNHLTENKFMWQDDYYAVSVSESHAQQVINYIKNQDAHHAKWGGFREEEDELIRRYGFIKFKD